MDWGLGITVQGFRFRVQGSVLVFHSAPGMSVNRLLHYCVQNSSFIRDCPKETVDRQRFHILIGHIGSIHRLCTIHLALKGLS